VLKRITTPSSDHAGELGSCHGLICLAEEVRGQVPIRRIIHLMAAKIRVPDEIGGAPIATDETYFAVRL
jgi:hypothetical protein